MKLVEEELALVIGIGNSVVKEKIRKKITNKNIYFPALLHPSVIVYSSETVNLGEGVVIGANSVLTENIEIENFVYLNTNSIISHDTNIGEYSLIMPTVSISAGAKIGKRVYVGNGTKIDFPIIIENDTVIKAGTVLSKE
ncbi:hypothetical protein DS884_17605 [Tenacibaculum sp. E3R01]|nr:hypothetical protein DS884_17605 [Tenacibaculum sp. E3R01]